MYHNALENSCSLVWLIPDIQIVSRSVTVQVFTEGVLCAMLQGPLGLCLPFGMELYPRWSGKAWIIKHN